MAASRKTLGELHSKLAAVLAEALDGTAATEYDEDGEPTGKVVTPPAPAVMAVAAKFLKDNSIFGDVESDEHLRELRDKLKAAGRNPTQHDFKDALGEVQRGLLQ